MTQFAIEGPQTVDTVEVELRAIHRQKPTSLILPKKPKDWWFGGEGALAQLVITWARLQPEGVVLPVGSAGRDPQGYVAALAKRLYGFVALMMSGDIRMSETAESYRTMAFESCRAKVLDMEKGPNVATIGSKVYLCSVDHSTKWRLPPLYDGERVKDHVGFVSLTRDLFARALKAAPTQHVGKSSIDEMGVILQELFQNTHDWARSDSSGRLFRRSVRGLTIERHSRTVKEVEQVTRHSGRLRHYLQANLDTPPDRIRLIELNVFDSGVGLASRWLKEAPTIDWTLQNEFDACMSCLKHRMSTAAEPGRGIGLYRVLSCISGLKGLLRVRTGRLALYRDFAAKDATAIDLEVPTLLDWSTGSTKLTEMPRVEGTLITALIPIQRNEERT